jgi:hypothetical protein
MTLAIINGSPRKSKSNSDMLIQHFLAGYHSNNHGGIAKTSYLMGKDAIIESLNNYWQAQQVIIIFPLYTDCMPGIVKEFLEKIYRENDGIRRDMGFIVQSGFPEAIHSMYVERYLEKFTRRMGYNYLGTVIKGGVEGIQVMPPAMTKGLFSNIRNLGEHFGTSGKFCPEIITKLLGEPRMSPLKLFGFRLLSQTGLMNFYWNSHLKKYGAYEKRDDRPLLGV